MLSSRDVSLATVLGLGHLRPAPGTWGSLPPVLIAAALLALGLGPGEQPLIFSGVMVLLLLAGSAACVLQGDAAEVRFFRKDPPQVVADELAGMSLALVALPARATASPALAAFTLAYAFVAFRVLDIVKPPPADGLQRVAGGWGVLLDDLAAGAMALVLVQVLARTMT